LDRIALLSNLRQALLAWIYCEGRSVFQQNRFDKVPIIDRYYGQVSLEGIGCAARDISQMAHLIVRSASSCK